MKDKYKYLVSVFSVLDDLDLGVKAEFYSLKFAKKYKKSVSLTLEPHLSCRIIKEKIIPKIFNQTTPKSERRFLK